MKKKKLTQLVRLSIRDEDEPIIRGARFRGARRFKRTSPSLGGRDFERGCDRRRRGLSIPTHRISNSAGGFAGSAASRRPASLSSARRCTSDRLKIVPLKRDGGASAAGGSSSTRPRLSSYPPFFHPFPPEIVSTRYTSRKSAGRDVSRRAYRSFIPTLV